MIRPSTLLWLVAVLLSGYGMFQVKDEVYRLDKQLARIERQTNDGRDQIRRLNADWSYLTQPTRIDALAKRHLQLQPVTNAQLGRIETLPERPSPQAPQNVAALAGSVVQ